MPEEKHLPGLDGLRGLAIALVMLGHTLIPGAAGWLIVARSGWVGVDLFFVLSGFLITGILLDSRGAATYFRAFYARRVLRIFPLYYAFVAVLLFTAPLYGPAVRAQLLRGAPWLFGYVSNVFLAVRGWDSLPLTAGITWSLAIEEQFYLVWPAVVLLAGPRHLPRVTGCLLGLAVALRAGIWLAGGSPTAAYTLTPAHMDGLAVGAFLAVAHRQPERFPWVWTYARSAVLLAGVVAFGLIAAGGGIIFAQEVQVQLLGYTSFAVGFGGLLVLALRPGPVGRLLATAPLRFLGRYSYALYLLHKPAILAVSAAGFVPTDKSTTLAFFVVYSAVAISAALISWHLWEKRWLALKRYVPYGRPRTGPVGTAETQVGAGLSN